jgi:hypothetical protein
MNLEELASLTFAVGCAVDLSSVTILMQANRILKDEAPR